MHYMTKISALVLGTCGLVACDEAPEGFEFATTFESFGAINGKLGNSADGLVTSSGELEDTEDLADNNFVVSDSDDFDAVTAGSVTYNGAIIAQRDDADPSGIDSTLIGQLEIDVALATNTMDGRAGNFIDSEDGSYSGLLLGNTTFVEAADPSNDISHFDMELTGALNNGGNAGAVTVMLDGFFLNEKSTPIEVIAGGATVDLGSAGPDYVDGAFAARR